MWKMEPRLPSFRAWLDARCVAGGERTFLEFRGRSWSYAALARATDAVAAALHARGLAPGDRLAIALPNSPEHLFAWLGAAKLGAAVAPLHAQWTAAELERALARLRPRLLAGDLPGGIAREEIARWLEGAADAASARFPEAPATPAEAPAELLFTSGTTGLPKAAVQSYRALILTGEAFADWLRLGPDDRLFTCLPLAHVNARFYSTLGAIAAGAALVLEEKFSASSFWRWMAESGATVVNTIGAMLRILLQAPRSEAERAHRLRLVYTAPALGAALHREFEARFGVRLVVGYGMTECTFGFVHPLDLPLESPARRLGSMGRPRRHPDPRWATGWRLVDPASAGGPTPRDVAPGEVGEIWLSGPTVFTGYFEGPAATAGVLRPDGWLRTGDLATRDADDFWTFVGRTKEMIRRRGENVSPLEVEELLLAHPAVAEAVVVGVPAELGEEEVAAFVVPKAGASVTAEELRDYCAARLARFKLPTAWRFLDSLPRTSTNRVAKGELRAQFGIVSR
jgi:crotonobetaine/carnitine-CoA ligase